MMRIALALAVAWPVVATAAAPPPSVGHSITVRLPPPLPARPLPPVAGPEGRPLIVIDAGHGGHDPGAGDGRVREKDVTLALALDLRRMLLAGGRVRVALTRGDDRYLGLHERAEQARALRADLLLSLHADSAPVAGATGATVYTLAAMASDAGAARTAARENAAGGVNSLNLAQQSTTVRDILFDLSRRDAAEGAERFVRLLRREAGTRVPFRPDYHRSAAFVVLRAPDVPSVLFEAGYLSNPGDAARLLSPGGRAAIAEAVRRAVAIYAAERAQR